MKWRDKRLTGAGEKRLKRQGAKNMKKQILALHGANLNLLGMREPQVYGQMTLETINQCLQERGLELGIEVRCRQSNLEGELVNQLQEAQDWAFGVILNPGGYTHTSVVIRDAIAAIRIPVVEVHISNIMGREDFRHISMISAVCRGTISGFGWYSYMLGLEALAEMARQEEKQA
jgi:3-dehydroquinate dehydratase-2